MVNNQIRFTMNDKIIREGLEELASEVSVPDTGQAYKEYKIRHHKRNKTKPIIAAAVVILLFAVTLAGPARALDHIRQTVTEMLTKTDKLFQRTGIYNNDDEPIHSSHGSKSYYSLEELRKENTAGIFIPAGLQNDQFQSAEVNLDTHFFRVTYSIDYAGVPLSLKYYSAKEYMTSGLVIDIEDFDTEVFIIEDREITCFFDDQGYTSLQWENSEYLFMFEGNLSADQLINAGLALEIFD